MSRTESGVQAVFADSTDGKYLYRLVLFALIPFIPVLPMMLGETFSYVQQITKLFSEIEANGGRVFTNVNIEHQSDCLKYQRHRVCIY